LINLDEIVIKFLFKFKHFVESLFHTFVQIVPDVTPEMAAGWKKFVMLLIQQITSSMEMEIQESK